MDDDGIETMLWQNKMIAFLASDGTWRDFNKLFKRTDFGKVFGMYVLKTAASLKG